MKQFFKILFASCLGVFLAGVAVVILLFSAMGAFVSSLTEDLSSSSGTPKAVTNQSVLLLDLKGKVTDAASDRGFVDLFSKSSEQKTFSLPEIIRALDCAAENPNVAAICLQLQDCSMGFATAKEIRDRLKKFKESGKPIYAYADSYSYGNYYLSSLADSIYINPSGSVAINGLSLQTLFMRGPLAKLGIKMEVFKVGTFKGAVEPFLLDKLSEPNRMQMQEILGGVWTQTTQEIAQARKISQSSLQQFADRGDFVKKGEYLQEVGLVDQMLFQTELNKRIAYALSDNEDTEVNYVRVNDVNAEKQNEKGDLIALVIAEGNIVNVDPEDHPVPNPMAGKSALVTKKLIKKLRKVAEDDNIKSVVLRVNSPGGDAFLSDLIYHEVEYVKSKKPIVVSMGDYAASGGYYISAPASMIVAEPTTLTGSIGIFGMFPNMAGTAQKIDLKEETVKTARYADLGTPFRLMTDDERAVIQNSVEKGYDLFLTRVSQGRNIPKTNVDSIGQGRVWLGEKALELGLVDKLGGLTVAIQEAARLAELDNYRVSLEQEDKSWWQKIFGFSSTHLSGLVRGMILSPEEKAVAEAFTELRQRTGIMALPVLPVSEIRMPSTTVERPVR